MAHHPGGGPYRTDARLQKGDRSTQRRSRGHRPEGRGRGAEFMPFPRTPPAEKSRLRLAGHGVRKDRDGGWLQAGQVG